MKQANWREIVVVVAVTLVYSSLVTPASAQGDLVYVADGQSGIVQAHFWRAGYPPTAPPFFIGKSSVSTVGQWIVTANLLGDGRDELVVVRREGTADVYEASLLRKHGPFRVYDWGLQPLVVPRPAVDVTAGNVLSFITEITPTGVRVERLNKDQLIVARYLDEFATPSARLYFYSWDGERLVPQRLHPLFREDENWWKVWPDFSGSTQIAAGRIDSADSDWVVVADPQNDRITVYGTYGLPNPTVMAEDFARDFDQMTVGDVDGDGDDEVLIAKAPTKAGVNAWVQPFAWKALPGGLPKGELVPLAKEKQSFPRWGDAFLMADVLGDKREELLIANSGEQLVDIYQWRRDPSLSPPTHAFVRIANLPTSFDSSSDGLAAGAGYVCDWGVHCDDNRAPLIYETNPWSAKYDFGEVDKAVEKFINADGNDNVEGLTLAVVRKAEGQIYEKGYGKFKRNRVSLLASVTKTLSAGVILSLVDEGLLDLKTPVKEYLADWVATYPGDWGKLHSEITIEHLLSMMSGLVGGVPRAQQGLPPKYDPCVEQYENMKLQDCGNSIFKDENGSTDPADRSTEPEKEFRYGPNHWQLAGAVAEVVSGKSWATLVAEKLVVPCGLQNTSYGNLAFLFEYPRALIFEEFWDEARKTQNQHIGAGAVSTVNDLSKVLLMHLNGGRCGQTEVLSRAMVQRMQEDHVPPGVNFPPWGGIAKNYGMGWWKHAELPPPFEDWPPVVVGSGAWGARMVLVPDEDWGGVLIIEADSATGDKMLGAIGPAIREAIRMADQN